MPCACSAPPPPKQKSRNRPHLSYWIMPSMDESRMGVSPMVGAHSYRHTLASVTLLNVSCMRCRSDSTLPAPPKSRKAAGSPSADTRGTTPARGQAPPASTDSAPTPLALRGTAAVKPVASSRVKASVALPTAAAPADPSGYPPLMARSAETTTPSSGQPLNWRSGCGAMRLTVPGSQSWARSSRRAMVSSMVSSCGASAAKPSRVMGAMVGSQASVTLRAVSLSEGTVRLRTSSVLLVRACGQGGWRGGCLAFVLRGGVRTCVCAWPAGGGGGELLRVRWALVHRCRAQLRLLKLATRERPPLRSLALAAARGKAGRLLPAAER